jgi:hypothetical protein
MKYNEEVATEIEEFLICKTYFYLNETFAIEQIIKKEDIEDYNFWVELCDSINLCGNIELKSEKIFSENEFLKIKNSQPNLLDLFKLEINIDNTHQYILTPFFCTLHDDATLFEGDLEYVPDDFQMCRSSRKCDDRDWFRMGYIIINGDKVSGDIHYNWNKYFDTGFQLGMISKIETENGSIQILENSPLEDWLKSYSK